MFASVLLAVLQVCAIEGLIKSGSHRVPFRPLQMSKVQRNENFAKLQAGYLFPEIARRRNAYLAANPGAKIISLGIGDTTQPVPEHILGMKFTLK